MTTHKLLVALGAFLLFGKLPTSGPTAAQMAHAAHVRMEAAETAHARRPWPAAVAERRLRAVFVFGYYESSWYADPRGWNDAGYACGVMQVHDPERDVQGATCRAVRADRALGWEVGIARIQRLERECGSIAAALTAYAWDGACHGSTVLDVVKTRCRRAGLDPSTCE